MAHKCDECFWKTDWNGGEYPICERLWYEGFDEAKDECATPGQCQYYMTDEEADEIVDKLNDIPN